MPKSTPLADEVAKVAERVRKATKGKLNEQNTNSSMIEPVLRALGWDTEDVDEVVREFTARRGDRPASGRELARDERVELLDVPR